MVQQMNTVTVIVIVLDTECVFADTIALVSSGVNINVPVCMLLKSERRTSLDTCVCSLKLNKYVFNHIFLSLYFNI